MIRIEYDLVLNMVDVENIDSFRRTIWRYNKYTICKNMGDLRARYFPEGSHYLIVEKEKNIVLEHTCLHGSSEAIVLIATGYARTKPYSEDPPTWESS